ncbi:hypothetical protein [Erythrobacter ani]|uniref:CDP-glycerol glycerophosphotransferase, TagB/SpsB family n=1 Tax=Erythrobacter ani TaxID=2827235 RepID=A0ABS6SPL3_9SPHN|nr:hypothetical protein [Erythrobacter ani]MBV7266952.1 hypothetical protein [Erythrobacter ani]
MQRALFLFNHDAPHQVAHLARIAAKLAISRDQISVIVAYSTPSLRVHIEQAINAEAARALTWVELTLGKVAEALTAVGDKLFPASRLLRLRTHAGLFESCDVIVSSERTFLRIKQYIEPVNAPLFVKIPHGAGDRAVTFHQDNTQFDLLLVSGRKFRDEFVSAGVEPEKIAVVGYPKFEGIDFSNTQRFFENDNPTFLYNPHFDPHLSSWYDAGPDLLRWFASDAGQAFNCIFAPHVMLFRKNWHFSPEHRSLRASPPVPTAAHDAPNILVDTDGPRLFDMSYTISADAYIGDASSQIYEFLIDPRPAFFLDTAGAVRTERAKPPAFQGTGPVIQSVGELVSMLPDWRDVGAKYHASQQELVSYTFDLSDIAPSERAADAIADLLAREKA